MLSAHERCPAELEKYQADLKAANIRAQSWENAFRELQSGHHQVCAQHRLQVEDLEQEKALYASETERLKRQADIQADALADHLNATNLRAQSWEDAFKELQSRHHQVSSEYQSQVKRFEDEKALYLSENERLQRQVNAQASAAADRLNATNLRAQSWEDAFKGLQSRHHQISAQHQLQVEGFEQEKALYVSENERLKRQVDDRANAVTDRSDKLDVFGNTFDQVSEADVLNHGPTSVTGLNQLVDELILNLMEQSQLVLQSISDGGVGVPSPDAHQSDPLTVALTSGVPNEEHQEFLLDACLHSIVIQHLYERFFSGTVATYKADRSQRLEKLYRKLDETSKKFVFRT